MPPDSRPPHPIALVFSWIIWALLILGQLSFISVENLILSQNRDAQPGLSQMLPLFIVNAAMLIILIPLAFLLRRFIFNRSRGKSTTAASFLFTVGNIFFWLGCESVSFFALIIALINKSFFPSIFIFAVSFAIQVIAFPRVAQLRRLCQPLPVPA